jgi:glycosyltransferase involved in cell wall biosynthesis
MKRYAFITPRYAHSLIGGAEMLCGTLARLLASEGAQVELWTTTAKDNRTWEHFYEAGPEPHDDFIIRRFHVNPRDLEKWIPLQLAMNRGESLTFQEQCVWAEEGVVSSALLSHIAQHGESYDALFFAPYWVTTTTYGSVIHPERSVLIPCLHDEAFAYLDVVRGACASVKKAIFNSLPEQLLAQRLYPSLIGTEVGMPFVKTSTPRGKCPFITEGEYLLYLGRKEEGKGVSLLIDYFCAFKDGIGRDTSVSLVIAGGGSFEDLHRSEALQRGDILDVSSLTDDEKRDAIDHALLLVQPSTLESFSIVIMEAWERGTPVLVHGLCPVTRHAVVQSGGGLFFSSSEDFSGVLETVLESKQLLSTLGKQGQSFVHSYYSVDAVTARLHGALKALFT